MRSCAGAALACVALRPCLLAQLRSGRARGEAWRAPALACRSTPRSRRAPGRGRVRVRVRVRARARVRVRARVRARARARARVRVRVRVRVSQVGT